MNRAAGWVEPSLVCVLVEMSGCELGSVLLPTRATDHAELRSARSAN